MIRLTLSCVRDDRHGVQGDRSRPLERQLALPVLVLRLERFGNEGRIRALSNVGNSAVGLVVAGRSARRCLRLAHSGARWCDLSVTGLIGL